MVSRSKAPRFLKTVEAVEEKDISSWDGNFSSKLDNTWLSARRWQHTDGMGMYIAPPGVESLRCAGASRHDVYYNIILIIQYIYIPCTAMMPGRGSAVNLHHPSPVVGVTFRQTAVLIRVVHDLIKPPHPGSSFCRGTSHLFVLRFNNI